MLALGSRALGRRSQPLAAARSRTVPSQRAWGRHRAQLAPGTVQGFHHAVPLQHGGVGSSRDEEAERKEEGERGEAAEEEEEEGEGESSLRTRVLEAALLHVPEQGWTEEALARGADDVELSIAAAGMFPGGPTELVRHFVDSQNKRLAKELPEIIATAEAKWVVYRIVTSVET